MTDAASIPSHVVRAAHNAPNDLQDPPSRTMAAAIAAALDALFTDEPLAVTDTNLEGQVAVPKAKVRPSDVLAAVLARDDEGREDTGDERFGAGVCVTKRCIEPCGRNGGCAR